MSKQHFGVQCPDCKKRIFSYHRHDYKTCGCPNQTMVDGGFDYLRYGWSKKKPKCIKHNVKKDGPLPVSNSERWPY